MGTVSKPAATAATAHHSHHNQRGGGHTLRCVWLPDHAPPPHDRNPEESARPNNHYRALHVSPARLSSTKNVLETLLFSSEADEKRPFSSRFFAPHHLSSFLPWGLSSRLTSQQPGGPPPPTSQSLPIFFQTSSCLPDCTACRFPLRRGFRCLSGGGVAWGARQAGSPLARGPLRPTPLPFSSLQHVPLP